MKTNFDENKFINNIVNYYINCNNNNYSLIFDVFFIKMTKINDCNALLDYYCTKEEIEDAKYRFKDNYVELKLSLILYHKFINALIDKRNKYIK
jgi:hypothetical protein